MPRALILILMSRFALAQTITAPSNFSSSRNGLAIQALGSTCFSFDVAADTLPCNPAFMAKQQEQGFKIIFFGDNNISNMSDAVALIRGSGKQSNVQNLFSSQTNSELDAKIEGAYMTHNFALAYEPFAISYLSVFRNPALPQITLFASVENSARMQLASFAANDIYVGVQVRYLNRQLIASQFFLTDLLAENGSNILNPQEEQFYFLEPGILYAPPSDFWNPQMTFNLINWGLHVNSIFNADPLPEAHLGFSISPPIGWGHWGWALDTAWNQNIVNPIDAFTLGSYYQMGILKAFGSVSTSSSGVGFSVLFDHFNLGLSYTSTLQYLDAEDTVMDQRMYFLLGGEL